jgi:hypothetical protein
MRQQKPSHYTRWTLLFSEPQAAWMIEEAARLGITIGEMVRRIIDEKRVAWDPSNQTGPYRRVITPGTWGPGPDTEIDVGDE